MEYLAVIHQRNNADHHKHDAHYYIGCAKEFIVRPSPCEVSHRQIVAKENSSQSDRNKHGSHKHGLVQHKLSGQTTENAYPCNPCHKFYVFLIVRIHLCDFVATLFNAEHLIECLPIRIYAVIKGVCVGRVLRSVIKSARTGIHSYRSHLTSRAACWRSPCAEDWVRVEVKRLITAHVYRAYG